MRSLLRPEEKQESRTARSASTPGRAESVPGSGGSISRGQPLTRLANRRPPPFTLSGRAQEYAATHRAPGS